MIAQTRLRDPAPGTKLALDDHVTQQRNQLVVKGSAQNGRLDRHKEQLRTPATRRLAATAHTAADVYSRISILTEMSALLIRAPLRLSKQSLIVAYRHNSPSSR